MKEYEFQEWITRSEIKRSKYSKYWSDEELEKSKEWYVLNGNFEKMETYLKKSGLLRQLEEIIERLRGRFGRELQGTGADLAAGTLWAVPHLIKSEKVRKIYCVEYSRHRLLKIGPKVLKHYGVPKDKVILALGSFYKLKLPDNSLDFVLMSSAFHHADDPNALLTEIRRVLKPGGVVVIIGEHIREATLGTYIKNVLKFLISLTVPARIQYRLFGTSFHVTELVPDPDKLFPLDPVVGDRFYTYQQYRGMFSSHGFNVEHLKDDASGFQAFILVSNDEIK